MAVVSQIGAERNVVATALRDEGKVEEARKAFRMNSAYLKENAAKLENKRLDQDAAANYEASENLDDEGWTRERKKQKELQYKTQTQRARIEPQKKD